MDWVKFAILLIGFAGGNMIGVYKGEAPKRDWPVVFLYHYPLTRILVYVSIITSWGCVVLSFFVIPWWGVVLLVVGGWYVSGLFVNILKILSPPIGLMMVILCLSLIPFFVIKNG